MSLKLYAHAPFSGGGGGFAPDPISEKKKIQNQISRISLFSVSSSIASTQQSYSQLVSSV
jgi:hypothetical protein